MYSSVYTLSQLLMAGTKIPTRAIVIRCDVVFFNTIRPQPSPWGAWLGRGGNPYHRTKLSAMWLYAVGTALSASHAPYRALFHHRTPRLRNGFRIALWPTNGHHRPASAWPPYGAPQPRSTRRASETVWPTDAAGPTNAPRRPCPPLSEQSERQTTLKTGDGPTVRDAVVRRTRRASAWRDQRRR